MAKEKMPDNVLELAVSFGNVSIGKETAKISLTCARGELTLNQADKNLCGKRLIGSIISRPPGAQGRQTGLPGMDGDINLKGIFDVKGFSVKTGGLSFGLTFKLQSIDIEKLSHFAGVEGMLYVNDVQAIPDDKPDAGGNDEEEKEDE